MENIALISACNPYKLRDKELSQQTSGLQYKAKDETMSRLVYRVNPLPESMISYIWDYKSLNLDEERKYIEKMIQQKYENSTITGKSFSLLKLWVAKKEAQQLELRKIGLLNKEVSFVSTLVQNLQRYIKEKESSPWAVSLRDVSRFCHFLVYFNDNSISED